MYYDYSSDRGVMVMDRATFVRALRRQRRQRLDASICAPAPNTKRARSEILTRIGESHRVVHQHERILRAEVLRIFDSTFAITYALEIIAIVVAMLGVAATLLTLILERRARVIDPPADRRRHAGRSGEWSSVEAALIGAVSQAIGLVVGLLLSLVLIYVINVQSFGWTIQFHLPAAFLIQASILMVLATALAGIYPARRAQQLGDVLDAARGVSAAAGRGIEEWCRRGGLPRRREQAGGNAALRERRANPRQRPGSAIGTRHQLLRLRVADDLLLGGIPLDAAAGPERDVPEVACDHRVVPDLDIRTGRACANPCTRESSGRAPGACRRCSAATRLARQRDSTFLPFFVSVSGNTSQPPRSTTSTPLLPWNATPWSRLYGPWPIAVACSHIIVKPSHSQSACCVSGVSSASSGKPNLPPTETAAVGAVTPIPQLAMSIMWAPQSVISPPE